MRHMKEHRLLNSVQGQLMGISSALEASRYSYNIINIYESEDAGRRLQKF